MDALEHSIRKHMPFASETVLVEAFIGWKSSAVQTVSHPQLASRDASEPFDEPRKQQAVVSD